MSAFLSSSKKGLLVRCMRPADVHSTQNLPELFPHSSKPVRGRTPHSLPGRFRLLDQCRPGKRAGQGATTSLLLQPSPEGSKGEIPEDGEVDPSVGNYIQKTSTLLPSSHRRSPNRIFDEANTA